MKNLDEVKKIIGMEIGRVFQTPYEIQHASLFTCHCSFLCFSPSSGMSGNAQNFPMGSNAHEHPQEVNRQSGARRPRVARAENQPPLPARVVNKSIINGTQLHDYGFMGLPTRQEWLPTCPTLTPIHKWVFRTKAQHQEDSSALLDPYNIPIRSGLNGNESAPIYTSMQMDQFGQPRFHQGDMP
ncbi:hypothetical protein F0562_007394 [Nyssa sinensis]|uniref:Uncharacterized protein n=1 Tax=Nyssa sinensis TaxID=561372 RepID=A0A5J5A3W6_9ASTE|nr:hypothetical protein F0562_007394 [Nyssa sinensis]